LGVRPIGAEPEEHASSRPWIDRPRIPPLPILP
jgi:hypothetical protein